MLPTIESPFCRVGSQIVYAEWQKFVNITMHVIGRRGKYKKTKKIAMKYTCTCIQYINSLYTQLWKYINSLFTHRGS